MLLVWSFERPAGGIGCICDFSLEELMLRVVAAAGVDSVITSASTYKVSGI